MFERSTLIVVMLVFACGMSSGCRSSDSTQDVVDVGVLSHDLTWTDENRDRLVPVRVFTPASSAGDVAHPILIFSHGLGESRESFGYLGNHLAGQGFVIVFITHIGHDAEAIADALESGNLSGFGNPENLSERPDDMSFVIDRVFAGDIDDLLASGSLDLDRLAVAGQCAGSSTALALAGMTLRMADDSVASFRDARAKAVFALGPQPRSGSLAQYYLEDSWSHVEVPALVFTGSLDFDWIADVRANPSRLREPFLGIPEGDKHLVELIGAEHHAFTDSVPWYPAGERNPEHHGWISRMTTLFLNATLRDDAIALDELRTHSLESETGGAARQALPRDDGLYEPAVPDLAVIVADDVMLHDSSRDRDVWMRVTYPEAGGPYPVLSFSHAVGGTRRNYTRLVKMIASKGYIVIQPDHPDSPLAEGLTDEEALQSWRERPEDVSFLLDALEDGSLAAEIPGIAGKPDMGRIGGAGHYIGAGTANLLLGTKVFPVGDEPPETYIDERIDLSLAFSPTGTGQGLTTDSWAEVEKPMLVLTGSRDFSGRTGNLPEWRTEPFFHSAAGDKLLVWIEELDSSYGGLASQLTSKAESEMVDWIVSVSIAFLDAHLKATDLAFDYLASDDLTWSTFEHVKLTAR